MKVLIAADSFKGSASSKQVAAYLAAGLREAQADVEVSQVPIADGGEGTVESLVSACGGKIYRTEVVGPLGESVDANWAMLSHNQAVIELAQAAGLPLVKGKLRPLAATTYGVGQLLAQAIKHGAKRIYLGLGGSASTDGGVGLAQALGGHFLDAKGAEVKLGGGHLKEICQVDLTALDKKLDGIEIIGLADVTNPLTGPLGAAAVFGPQKGASAAEVQFLDASLAHLAQVVAKVRAGSYQVSPGAGAAGGTGYGLLAFLGGRLQPGIETIMELIGLEKKLVDQDLVITGEGRLDGQSLNGKAPLGIAKLAKKQGLPVIAVTGGVGAEIESVYKAGIDLVLFSTTRPMPVEEAIKQAPSLIKAAGYTALKAYLLGR